MPHALCGVQCSMLVRCAVCGMQCAVFGVQYAVCSVQCAVCSVQCSMQCAVCGVQYAVCSVRCAVCSAVVAAVLFPDFSLAAVTHHSTGTSSCTAV